MGRWVEFPTQLDKAKWLDAAASEDATSPTVQRIAQVLAGGARLALPGDQGIAVAPGIRVLPGVYPRGGIYPILIHLHAVVRDGIEYRRDRVHGIRWEEFADTLSILRRGYDDCDGKSRVLVALVRALTAAPPPWMQGLRLAQLRDTRARIRPVFEGRNFAHVQPELRWPGSEQVPGNDDGWVIAEVIVEGAGIGTDIETLKGPNGYKMAGPRTWQLDAL